MAGYLDQYGAGYEQKHKRNKLILYSLVAIIVVGSGLYLVLHNHRQKARVTEFVGLLQKHDYPAGYAYWGCSEAQPCKDYPYTRFLEDWGPKSTKAEIASFSIKRAQACSKGTGVIVTVDFGQNREEKLWVENSNMVVGFSPWPVCPPN